MIWVVWTKTTKKPKCTNYSNNINTVNGSDNNKYSRISLTLTVRWIYIPFSNQIIWVYMSLLPSWNLHHVPLLAFYNTIMSLFSFFPKLLFFCNCWGSLGLPLCSLLVVAWGEKGLTRLPAVEVQFNEPILCPLQTALTSCMWFLLLRAFLFLFTDYVLRYIS